MHAYKVRRTNDEEGFFMESVRVILWGLGAMGSGIAKLLCEKRGVSIVGAIAGRPDKRGRDLGEVIGLGRNLGVTVDCDSRRVLGSVEADIVVLATDSFLKNVYPQIELILKSGKSCVTIAEEMSNPYTVDERLSNQIDELAKSMGVSVLGTGINPGFVLDTLIIALSGACRRVDRIRASRINDLSPFGSTVMRTQGVGVSPEQFREGIKDGSIVGHIGFRQSIPMIADALGLGLDRVIEKREPIISKTHRETPYVTVEPGMVAGCRHTGIGLRGEDEIITLVHPQQVCPEAEDVDTGDYINIEGDPDLNVSIRPEIPGGCGTIALAVNMIPLVLNSKPGLVTMADLPTPRAVMGNMYKLIRR